MGIVGNDGNSVDSGSHIAILKADLRGCVIAVGLILTWMWAKAFGWRNANRRALRVPAVPK